MKKFTALFLILAIIFAFSACSLSNSANEEGATKAEAELNASSPATTEAEQKITAASEESAEETSLTDKATDEAAEETGESPTEETTEDATENPTEKSTKETTEENNELPTEKAEVVELYKHIMDKAKQDKPGFTRLDYQELPSDSESRVISQGKGLINAALTFAGNFMKTKKQSEKRPTVGEKGGDMKDFPVKNTDYGCLLKNADGVKSAVCEDLGNGNAKITMILYAEDNPEPAAAGATSAPSYHGSICSPISKKEIDEDLSSGLFSGISYSLRYHDCVTELIFEKKSERVISQTQVNRVTIKGEGTIGFVTLKIDKQELINHVDIINLVY